MKFQNPNTINNMTLEEATDILEKHNVWRRSTSDFPTMSNPTLLGIAIDTILADMEVRKYTKSDMDDVYDKGVSDGINKTFLKA